MTMPMSRRGMFLTVVLPVAKSFVAEPYLLQVNNDSVWLDYATTAGNTFEQARQAAAYFGATEKVTMPGKDVTRWYTPAGAPLDLSVWWHGEAEPEEVSALAEEVVGALGPARPASP